MGTSDEDELGKLGGERDSAEDSAAIRGWLRLARRIVGVGEDQTRSTRDRGQPLAADERSTRR